MVKSRDHFDRTPSNVVWIAQAMLLEPFQWLDCSSKLILEPFTGLQVSPNLQVWTLRARITRTSRFAFKQSIVHD